MTHTINTIVIGAGGYVGGELLRLIATHPNFALAAAVSRSRADTPVGALLTHLAPSLPNAQFVAPDDALNEIAAGSELAVFAAAPHGASGQAIAALLEAARAKSLQAKVVDLSADFRHPSTDTFESIYGVSHPAPGLLDQFHCAVPEHSDETPRAHVSHPGCFATAALLAAVPLFAADLIEADVFIAGITGSTGSGQSPSAGTHHPVRHSNLYAYKPLCHRHTPEIAGLIRQRTGGEATIRFVPHSGPFARGIHITLSATLRAAKSASDIEAMYQLYYADSPFVHVAAAPPRLKDVVASNSARIGIAVEGQQLVVFCVIDNLLKGAAGGAMQWMNRLWSLPEDTGLTAPAPNWT